MKKLIVLLSFLLFPAIASAQFVNIGSATVEHRAEKDTIQCSHAGPLTGIQFRPYYNDVQIFKMLVVYRNGEQQTIPVNAVYKKLQSSGYIDLPGVARVVKSVTFWYKTLNHKGPKAMVTLFGRQAPAQVRPVQPPPPVQPQPTWIHLGTQAVDHRAEKDTLNCAHKGLLKGIQFRVLHNDVRFLRFTVVYANGQTQQMPVNAVVKAGQSSAYYDLPGVARAVRSINFWYKTLNHKGPKAHVAVYGRQ